MNERFEVFTALIAGIHRCIRKIRTEEAQIVSLRGPQVFCLYHLYCHGSLTASELCELCGEDKANISRTVEGLQKEGYVVCRGGEEKRYRAPLELTEVGHEAGKNISAKIDSILQSASEGIGDAARVTLYESLAKIHENLRELCDAYGE